MSNDLIEAMASGCPYDQYDLETLAPLNQNTILRIAGLNWSKADFEGKTVLDIGANTGLLSIHAIKLGAKEVHATEVMKFAVDIMEYVAQRHAMPLRTSRVEFAHIRPEKDAADVVLFMEVMQWVMRDGEISVKEVLKKIVQLTKETLYIEFPWDADDPQIREMTKLTKENFSASLILTELSRYFRTVNFVRFMRYFGFTHSKGNRVLIKCTDLRPEALLLAELGDTDSLDLCLAGTAGMKRAYLFQSKTTLLVGKIVNSKASSALGPSPFSSLEPNVLNRLLDELARSSPKTLVLPNKINESYVTKSGGYNWMVYPYIGEASHLSENKHEFLQDEIIRTARRVTVELNSISAEIISELQRVGLGLDLSVFSEFAPFTSAFEQKIFSIDGLRVIYDLARKYPLESVNALAHYDLHSGNMVRDGDNIRVIDLETMQLGSICTDILRAAIWYNCTVDQIADGIQTLEACLARRVLSGEYAYGVGAWLAWFAVQPTESGESDINTYAEGLQAAVAYYHNRRDWG